MSHTPLASRRAAWKIAVIAVAAAALIAAAPAPEPLPQPTYADLADLAAAAPMVARVAVTSQAVVPPERAPNVAPGHARLFVEAATRSLIAGRDPLGESVRYLVDVPLDSRGKVPKLKKREFLLFARAVPGRPGELQLTGPAAQLPWSAAVEARLKPILAELAAPDAAPALTGIRDALSVPGTLTGESETQIFIATRSGDPASLSVVRRPGMAPQWGVSFTELIDQAATAPAPDTLAWYRLACFLPPTLPGSANLSTDSASRAQAADDYAFVIGQLGPCPRTLSRTLSADK